MLRSLQIRNLLLIDRLELDFEPGLNVLTGETGAGKSILLDSLGFALGWRGRAELVRPGAEQGEVVAEFEIGPEHPAQAVLAEHGLASEDGALILRRINTIGGRKAAWVNDRRVSGEVLRALSETLVELHGQHDDRGLLNPRGHRALLDAFAGLDLAPLRAAWAALAAAEAALGAERAKLAEAEREADFLAHAVAELDALAPEPGEDAALDERRRLMRAGARIREDMERALAAVAGEEGAAQRSHAALRWLEDVAGRAEGRLDGAIGALERAITELGEAEREVEEALEAMAFDPRELEQVEERLFAIRAAARKHGVAPDALPELAADFRARLEAVETGGARIRALEADLARARQRWEAAAREAREAREAAARRLDAAMAAELAPLKMERAVFTTVIEDGPEGPEGHDQVTFTVATNPGSPPGPLARIASGGELSRFLLALKVCLAGTTPGVTLIFDEIDRGVGGATADAVGRRLRALAEGSQVLVVTHSPQVAALGAHHWLVSKRVEGRETLSHVEKLSAAARRREIARMLSGSEVTPEAEAAAEALLAG